MIIDKNIITDDDASLTYALTLADLSPAPSWVTMTVPSMSASGDFEFQGTYPS